MFEGSARTPDQKASNSKGLEKLIDSGVWGPGSNARGTFIKENRALEEKVQALNGRKWLYAHTFHTGEQF